LAIARRKSVDTLRQKAEEGSNPSTGVHAMGGLWRGSWNESEGDASVIVAQGDVRNPRKFSRLETALAS
jgi:hypothetical protein